MKKLVSAFILLAAFTSTRAAIHYVDSFTIDILPFDAELNVDLSTGNTASTVEFSEYHDAPWLTFVQAGAFLGSSDLVGVWTNQTENYDGGAPGHFFQNVAYGSIVSATGVSGSLGSFALGAGSQDHIGNGAGQFVSGEPGYLAFSYMTQAGGDVAYGWLRFTPQISGSGVIVDMAYSDTPGEAITVGAIPEPASIAALAGAFGLGFAAYRRRRAAA